MHRARTIHSHAYRILCLISISLIMLTVLSMPVYAADNNTLPFDRYDEPDSSVSSADSSSSSSPSTSGSALDQAVATREEIELEAFNNAFFDTAVYIIGGIAGMMMLLQITAFAICKVYPSWNHLVAKLSVIGITGYEDGWLAPTIKILLLGVFAFLCISGTMKRIIFFILGWFVQFVNFN